MKSFLLKLSRSRFANHVAGFVFAHLSFLLPVKRVYSAKHVIAFRHPKPSYPVHILIIPKRRIRTLLDLATLADLAQILDELREAVCSLHGNIDNIKEYALSVNSGPRQEFMQLHLHLIKANPVRDISLGDHGDLISVGNVRVAPHPEPTHEVSLMLLPATDDMGAYIQGVVEATPVLDGRYGLSEKGFSLLCTFDDARDMVPLFYITAGKRI